MDALSLLKEDHDEVRQLFDELDATSPRATRTRVRLYEAIKEELDVHTQIEEEILYPAMKKAASTALRSFALEAVEDHRLVQDLLEELEDLTPNDEEFEAKVGALREQVLRHVEDEERAMFTEARKVLDPESLEQLGRELTERRRTLKAQPAHR